MTISRLEKPESWGDWHDKPLRWILAGRDSRLPQKFQTKKDAMSFRSKIRRGEAGY